MSIPSRLTTVFLLLLCCTDTAANPAKNDIANRYFVLYLQESFTRVGDVDLSPKEPLREYDIEDPVTGLGLAVGYEWPKWRVELEYSWRYRFDIDLEPVDYFPNYQSDVETSTLMINVYRNILKRENYSLYVGAGIGRGFHESVETMTNNVWPGGSFNNTRRSNDSAWSFIVMGSYHWKNLKLIGGYRYIDLGRFKGGPFRQSIGEHFVFSDYDSHEAFAGVEFPW